MVTMKMMMENDILWQNERKCEASRTVFLAFLYHLLSAFLWAFTAVMRGRGCLECFCILYKFGFSCTA